jgi:hypothetical protein
MTSESRQPPSKWIKSLGAQLTLLYASYTRLPLCRVCRFWSKIGSCTRLFALERPQRLLGIAPSIQLTHRGELQGTAS